MTTNDSTVLVTGATGNTGRPLVDALIRWGTPVRAMVRSEGNRSRLPEGVEIAVADFGDPASLAAALQRTARDYASLSPPEAAKAGFSVWAAKGGATFPRKRFARGFTSYLRLYLADGGGGELGILRLAGIHRRRWVLI